MPAAASTAPTTSSGAGSRSADSGTKSSVPVSATAASNTFSQKIDCQDHHCNNRPEASKPTTPLAPATAVQMLTAAARRCAGKLLVMVDSVAGMISAAPTPSKARSPASAVGSVVRVATPDPAPNTTRPTSSANRLP
ncbi:hypothetical protein NJB1907f44_14870 [Mycobacterium marinum]|nr:hypothetical protein NJB1907E90_00710 [Mycobacterium marinum]GJO03296.1 hypothetical protein NJB1808e29_27690 [Mycobacterium marinum]GJO05619.1 hypothetical protein NJB1907f34b_28760 [Mycobacterium marinum]GJO19458.1 hypothetical protein NJB1907E11_25210 [Mycobacterium marinum]GJO32091.1 hypothetical protein NJB1728e18_50130 [Mycobacterium marinum]